MKAIKILFFSFVLVFLLLGPFLVLAVEINYPQIPGTETPQDFMAKIKSGQYKREQAISLYVNYFYRFTLAIAGLVAFATVVIAGFVYLISLGNPARLTDARERISSAFLGLILLLASFIFIKILNPQLLVMKLPALPTTAPVVIPNPRLPGETVNVFWEIPLATLAQNVIELIAKTEIPNQTLKEKTEILKAKEEGLAILLNICNCQNLSPRCSAVGCQPLSCAGNKTDLCPVDAIDAKKQEVLNALSAVKIARQAILEAKFNLEKETTRLATAQTILKSCPHTPMDLQTFLGLKEELAKTEIKKPWPEIDSQKSLLTFYCQAEDELVNFALSEWEARVLELKEEKNIDPNDIPEPPPLPGVGPLPTGTPLPGNDNFPFSWPVASPYVSSPFGPSQEYFNCQSNHNGIDTYSSNGNSDIYSPAIGEVVAMGDLSENCPRRDCGGYLSPGGSYGRWLAIKHRVEQNGKLTEVTSLYGHLRETTVSINQKVERGEKVAVMDNTGFSCGSHLHFSLFLNFHTTTLPACGQADYPIGLPLDPISYLQTGVATGYLNGTPCQ